MPDSFQRDRHSATCLHVAVAPMGPGGPDEFKLEVTGALPDVRRAVSEYCDLHPPAAYGTEFRPSQENGDGTWTARGSRMAVSRPGLFLLG